MNEDAPKLTAGQQALLTTSGFIARYFDLCSYMPPPEAYESAERQYSAITGRNRYSCYKSFKVAKNRTLKQKK